MTKWKSILAALCVSITTLFFNAGAAFSHDLVFPAEKLKTLFPLAQSFEQKNLYISDVQRAKIEGPLKGRLHEEDLKPSIYLAIVKDSPDTPPRKAAAIIFIDAQGEKGKIEMGVVVGGKGELLKVQLFENKEADQLTRPAFLKQFEGKKAGDSFKVGSDITAPDAAAQSAQAVASGAKRGILIINEMFRKK
ncbi:MAG: hypothetical protein ACYC69_00035 [Thermodesulfovibrionales bacterium]